MERSPGVRDRDGHQATRRGTAAFRALPAAARRLLAGVPRVSFALSGPPLEAGFSATRPRDTEIPRSTATGRRPCLYERLLQNPARQSLALHADRVPEHKLERETPSSSRNRGVLQEPLSSRQPSRLRRVRLWREG